MSDDGEIKTLWRLFARQYLDSDPRLPPRNVNLMTLLYASSREEAEALAQQWLNREPNRTLVKLEELHHFFTITGRDYHPARIRRVTVEDGERWEEA